MENSYIKNERKRKNWPSSSPSSSPSSFVPSLLFVVVFTPPFLPFFFFFFGLSVGATDSAGAVDWRFVAVDCAAPPKDDYFMNFLYDLLSIWL